MRLFIKDESRRAKREGRDTVFTVFNFTSWAAENLNSPRAVWLYSMGFSLGAMFVVLRAAIRYISVSYTIKMHYTVTFCILLGTTISRWQKVPCIC